MVDLIDRQQVIDAIHYEYDGCCNIDESGSSIADDIERIIDNVPSVQPESYGDAVSRNAIVQKLNTMDRYISAELRLCDTDKNFSQNEVFIVDDVYEGIIEQLPSVQSKHPKGKWIPTASGRGRHECSRCHEYAPCYQDGSEHLSTFCVLCGAKMESR